MGSFGGNLGSTLSNAGTQLASVPSNVYQATGLGDIGQAVQGLFGGGETVPAAEFVGPPSPYQAPNFLQGLAQGFTGGLVNPSMGADVASPAGQLGGGVGELIAMLEKMRSQGGGGLAPMTMAAGSQAPRGVQILPGYHAAQAPSGGLIHNLIGAFTYGILGGAIPSGGQV
jgi:hypothetical protein